MTTHPKPPDAANPVSPAPADSQASALLRHLAERCPAMLSTLRSWVELESPSFQKNAVDTLGQALAAEFRSRGGQIQFHPSQNFGNHLQVDFPAETGAPILLLGHFDTVWETGTLNSMPCHESQGRLWGPGVLDMKAGIVQMLFAIEALTAIHGRMPRPVTVWLVTDEEVGSDSSRSLTEALAAKMSAVLVLEPAAGLHGALKTSRKGVGDYTVQVTGRAAHSGLDFEKGRNAIVELSRQVLEIAGFTDLDRGLTVNPGIIRGGTRTNVVPESAAVEVDIRVEKSIDALELDRRFRELKPFDKLCQISVSGGLNRPPMERTEKNLELFALARSLGVELGLNLQETSVGGGSDGNFTSALGIPTLDGLGAAGEGAHAVNESILISELAPRTALLARLIQSA